MHVQSKEAVCRTIQQIAERHLKPYGKAGIARMAHLLVLLKGVEWSVSLGSEATASRVWLHLAQKGVDMDWIRGMVGEFLFHSEYFDRKDALIEEVAASIAWINTAIAVPQEYGRLTAKMGDVVALLKNAPWLTFLYLLQLSDVVHLVSLESDKR
jgi:hypothetical protein